MKRIYIAESLVDGQLVVDRLMEAGVPAELFHQNASGGLGELPVTYPEVWLRRDMDLDKALHILSELSRDADSGGALRRCEGCSETSPANFEICWHCHRSFPVLAD